MPPKTKTFLELALDAGLKEATVKYLTEKHEIESVQHLVNLKTEDLDTFELSLGQKRSLEAWHAKLVKTKIEGKR